ncbi:fumarylacetoacetate hydrolase family protein [Aquabacter spiritensis]|uniref:2-keto-4-pentenoate hydratase/2-oxohepta-3-ene-1,7-dioic acid hydratase in catechol pathway n=1 Tax=Aquabacter spiritensis TaxID=933073 RepID=A0A4R3M396_9HYPH|nr:fumarylacetoacetate hydrolase family protein [Aquabacter spiritensis]TCT07701.1 2-keto-4-pentenoate hydratase/2-oxohepta-3-ene-1,7-dioic acid hydratase in catechol pathway [Aquabacter spiritensis]
MRFVTFRLSGAVRAGILQGDAADPADRVFDLGHPAFAAALDGCAPLMEALVERGLPGMVAALSVRPLPEKAALRLGEVALLAPLTPRRIHALAFNYKDALEERKMAPPDAPVLFAKQPETVIGPGAAIRIPPDVGGCTYEVEIAAVIGRRAEGVARADALAHVAGYTIFNDVSASELIKRDGGFARGKNLPTFGPLGPYLASADEVGDPHQLRLALEVDGATLQAGVSSDLVFDIADLIAFLSARAALEPGDVIATGTPAGVAGMRTPPAWLRPGSMVCARVEKLGALINPVAAGEPYGV